MRDKLYQGDLKSSQRRYVGPIKPGPKDLTEEQILKRMARIFVGDRIRFDSYKACYTADQVDRHGSTIKAEGIVTEHCGGYVMVRLRNGLTESVNYFDIEQVNGHGFSGYVTRAQSAASLASLHYMGDKLWS